MTPPKASKSPTQAATTPPQRPSLPTISSTIKVEQLPVAAETTESIAASEVSSDAPRKHKRRSTGSIDLTYRYHEPSDDELSWTEDEHGQRRRRKSKGKRGTGDDFRTGIIPSEGKKRRRRRRSGQSQQEGEEYSGSESESDSVSDISEEMGRKPRRKRPSGKGDDFKTGIIPREGKARRRRRSSSGKVNGATEEAYSSESEVSTDSDEDEKGPSKRKKTKERLSGKSDDFKTGIPHVDSRRRKKRKSATQEEEYLGDDSFHNDAPIPLNDENRNSLTASTPSPKKPFPPLSDGWTNIEWTVLEHTHDHIRGLGGPSPEKIDPTKLAEAFIRIYETSELKKKAEEEGMEKKAFTVEEVRDRIVALRKIRDRRRSGELPPARRLDEKGRVGGEKGEKGQEGEGMGVRRRISGIFGKFW